MSEVRIVVEDATGNPPVRAGRLEGRAPLRPRRATPSGWLIALLRALAAWPA